MNIDKALNFFGLVRASKIPSPTRRVNPALLTGVESKPWNPDAAALLKQFLHTGAGRGFMFQLAFFRPSFGLAISVEEVSLQAKFVAGYEAALTKIWSLAEPPADPVRTPEQYPSLDDDSAWGKTNREPL